MERPGVRADVFDALTSQQCNGVVVMTPDLRGGGYGLMAYGRGGENVDVDTIRVAGDQTSLAPST